MTTATAPTVSLQDIGRAVRELKIAAADTKRAEQINRAYLYLNASQWTFDGVRLVLDSATETGTRRYAVVNGACECPGWVNREQCWHADAWQIVITATQLVTRPRMPKHSLAELQAAADELFN